MVFYTPYTYGQLAAALARLGFIERRGKTDLNIPYRAFDNAEHGASALLPALADDQFLEHVHLRRTERAVELWGVADSDTFFRLLREAARKEMQAA